MGRMRKRRLNLELFLQDGRHDTVHPIPDQLVPRSNYYVWSKHFLLVHCANMSWRLTPATLRYVVPLLSGSRPAMGPLIFLSGARCASRFSPTSANPASFDVQEILGKALDFKGSLPGNKSPAEMWADKSNNMKLPPPPDTWTGMSADASTIHCRTFDTGRRLHVRNGDLQGAFQSLNLRLRQNHVAKEIALTVRHEKKGDKRARLRSERWRKRFADAVCRDIIPSYSRVLTVHAPVGSEKGATGQYHTPAWRLSEIVDACKTVCYIILSCFVNGLSLPFRNTCTFGT